MYKTINIIIPYFGYFPNYFQLFLNSCSKNPTIDWTIITDNTLDYNYPTNVRKVKMSFDEVKDIISCKFEFNVTIHNVHKLCEYKPAYGYIFDDLVNGYDFWGYGDIDLIYGDMRHYLTDEVLAYDKIFTLGHLSLVRNTEIINKLFMKTVEGRELYREAFTSEDNYNFDEEFFGKPNINTIFKEYGCKVWDKSYAADIYTKSNYFLIDKGDGTPEKRNNAVFVWNGGVLERYVKKENGLIEEEYMYIHLQKRAMDVQVSGTEDIYKIIPNSFESLEVDLKLIKKEFDYIRKKRPNNQYLKIRFHNLKIKIRQYARHA